MHRRKRKCIHVSTTSRAFRQLFRSGQLSDAATSELEVSRVTVFNTLRDANLHRHREWFGDKPVSLLFRATELAGEVGELCNAIKKLERERLGVKGSKATLEQLSDELADVVIAADLLAMQFGINVAEAIESKFNKTSKAYKLKTRLKFK
jgi:NTP pyrophosphatase (non-canonical NTP hydrolase)